MLYQTTYTSPIWKLTLASDGENLVWLWIEWQKYFQYSLKEEIITKSDLPIFKKIFEWLDAYFQWKNPSIKELSLKPIGWEFKQYVWEILLSIPYGKTLTYGEIAKQVAKKMWKQTMSSQAVWWAVGHNQISLIIPCHRVVGANKNLTGFAWGIDKKIQLLKLEWCKISEFHIPKKWTAL